MQYEIFLCLAVDIPQQKHLPSDLGGVSVTRRSYTPSPRALNRLTTGFG